MEIEGSTIITNRVTSTATGEGYGGGVVNGWVLDGGGGVAELHLRQSHVAGNEAQIGGGIANLDVIGYPTRTAEVFISQSTLASNLAAGTGSGRGSGGGLFNSNGAATVVNSTFSGNQALGDDTQFGGRGGGISNNGAGTTTTLQVLNATIAFNQASQAGGGIAVTDQVATSPTSIEAGNTLIVSNTLVSAVIASPQVIVGTESCSIENGSPSPSSLGGNIEDGTTCGLDSATDQQNTSVALGALTDNGGPTPTHMITTTGAAYNRGIDAICNAPPVNGVDQRGVTRPQKQRCDVGAVEWNPTGPLMKYFPQIYVNHQFTQ
jgi:hypothetical protein